MRLTKKSKGWTNKLPNPFFRISINLIAGKLLFSRACFLFKLTGKIQPYSLKITNHFCPHYRFKSGDEIRRRCSVYYPIEGINLKSNNNYRQRYLLINKIKNYVQTTFAKCDHKRYEDLQKIIYQNSARQNEF